MLQVPPPPLSLLPGRFPWGFSLSHPGTFSREASPAPQGKSPIAPFPAPAEPAARSTSEPGQAPLEVAAALMTVKRDFTALISPGFSFQFIHVAKMFTSSLQVEVLPWPGLASWSYCSLSPQQGPNQPPVSSPSPHIQPHPWAEP